MFQNNLLMAAASTAAGDFSVDYSCRFNDDDTASMTRTPSSAGNLRAFTMSFWIKRGNITDQQIIYNAKANSYLEFDGSDILSLYTYDSGSTRKILTQVFRDPTAWMHIVLAFDTENAVAADRTIFYINGVRVTNFSTDTPVAQDTDMSWTNDEQQRWGLYQTSTSVTLDAYLSQCCMIDGLTLTPTSFGEFDDNGVWRPIDVSGLTFGTTGYLLDFADSSNLGNDVSGNDNDWATTGLAATDQMTDTPTNNFCTLSSIDKSSNIPLSDGNLVGTFTSSWYNVKATFGVPSSGKWSFQLKGSSVYFFAGVIFGSDDYSDVDTNGTDALYYYGGAGIIATYRTGSYVQQTGLNEPTADVNMEILIDKDNDQIGIVIDDVVEMGTDSGLEIQDTMTKFFIQGLNNTLTVDFGQGGYEPSQSGYKALSTANLPTPTILDGTAHFQTTLYTGNATDRNISQIENSTFTPDFVWIKNRDTTDNHNLVDITRGVTKEINSNLSDAETTVLDGLQAFSDKLWIDASGETLIGDMTLETGLSSAFDGDNTKTYGEAAAGTSPGYCGVDWGSGNTKTITRMIVIGTTNTGYSASGRTIAITLEGSTDNFSSSVVDLGGGTGSFTDAVPSVMKMITPTSTTAYRYHRAKITSSVGSTHFGQVQFFEDNTGATRGFSLGNGPSGYNDNAEAFLALQWLAGGGAGSSNEDGGINTTTTTVNTAAGISISTYVGTGSATTVGHGLGAVPKMIMVKNRDQVDSWRVYHVGMDATAPEDYALYLNGTNARVDSAVNWNDTAPTSTVFSVGTDSSVNESSGKLVAYCFAEIEGFSSFGVYTGNDDDDGPVVYTGFTPEFVIIKPTTGTTNWMMKSAAINPYNVVAITFYANDTGLPGAESQVDFLSNGFKLRNDGDSNNITPIIYMAFAKYPFGGEDVTPGTAF